MNDTPTIDGEQPSAPERLAAGGREFARSMSWEANASRVLELYGEALG